MKAKSQNVCTLLYFNFHISNDEECNLYHSIAEIFSFLLMYIMLRLDHNKPRYQ